MRIKRTAVDTKAYEDEIADLLFALRMALYRLGGSFEITQKEWIEMPKTIHEETVEIVEGPDYKVRFKGTKPCQ